MSGLHEPPDWLRAHMQADDQAIARIQERLDAIKETLDKALDAHATRLDAYGARIRALELWRAYLAGGGAVLAGVVGYLVGR